MQIYLPICIHFFFWMTSVSVCSRFIGVQNKFKTMNGLNHISLWLCTACLWEEWCGQSDPQRERYRFFLFVCVCVCVCLLLLLPFQIFNFFLNKSYSLSACLVFSYFLILSRLLSLLRLFSITASLLFNYSKCDLWEATVASQCHVNQIGCYNRKSVRIHGRSIVTHA